MSNQTSTAEALPSSSESIQDRFHVDLVINLDKGVSFRDLDKHLTAGLGDFQKRNELFVNELEKLRLHILERKSWDLRGDNHDFLKNLQGIGLQAYSKIVLNSGLEEIITKVREEEGDDLSLTFNTPVELSFFWEMLYDGKPNLPPSPDNFWGFRYPIGRSYINIGGFGPSRIKPGRGIFTAIHEDLPHSRSEINLIEKMIVEVNDRLGLSLYLRFLENDIDAEKLSCEELIQYFASEEFRYGIVHFACHCENPEDISANQSYLLIKTGGLKLPLSIALMEEYQLLGGFKYKPFIFLNTCESVSVGHLLETTNFPAAFKTFGAGGIVATACTIPDSFANEFAKQFYTNLLQSGSSNPDIGKTLMQTRRYFIEEYNNPLGLAYGLYATSNQRLNLTAKEG